MATTTDQNEPLLKESNMNPKLSVANLTRPQRVKLQAFSKEHEMNHTKGVITVVTTTAIAVRFPAYYWIWHFLRSIFYIPDRYFRFRKLGKELYLLDFCYAVTYISTICFFLAFLRVTFGIASFLEQYNDVILRAGFAMSSGPLIWSIYVFRNSIVFEDVNFLTSVFIHMSPFTLMWCLRWGAGVPSVINAAFPDMFRICGSEEDLAAADTCLESLRGAVWCDACSAPLSDFVLPPAFLYLFVWAVPHFYLIFVRWGDWIKQTKRETLYAYFVETNPGLNAAFERNLGAIVGRKYAGPLGYMLLHLVISITTAASSYVLWHSFLVHTAVFIFILTKAIHNGSEYKFRVFAYRYAEGQLKKHQAVLD